MWESTEVKPTQAGKLLIYSGPTFLWKNYSGSIDVIHFKFGTVKDNFMVNVSIVLDFFVFCVFTYSKQNCNPIKELF